MTGMKSWMLGAAVVAGAMGLGAGTAQAAEFGVYMRGPVAFVPPCPGPGYAWIAGYQADGYWIPGRWELRAQRDRFDEGRIARFDRDRFRPEDRDRFRPDGRGWERR